MENWAQNRHRISPPNPSNSSQIRPSNSSQIRPSNSSLLEDFVVIVVNQISETIQNETTTTETTAISSQLLDGEMQDCNSLALERLQTCQSFENKTTSNEFISMAWITTYFLLTPITVISNALVIASIATHRNLHNLTYSFILNLAVADCMVGITMPTWSLFYMLPDLYNNKTVCLFMFIIVFVSYTCSIATLLAVALDRFIYITYPLHYHTIMTKRRGIKIITAVWVYSLVVGCLPIRFHSWNERTPFHVERRDYTVCIMECALPQWYLIFLSAQYSVFTIIMLGFYYVIFRTAKCHKQQILSEMLSATRLENKSSSEACSTEISQGLMSVGNSVYGLSRMTVHRSIDSADSGVEPSVASESLVDATHPSAADATADVSAAPSAVSTLLRQPHLAERIKGGVLIGALNGSLNSVDSESSPLTKQAFGSKGKLKRSLHKTTSMMIIVMIFVLCWTPFHFLLVYNSSTRVTEDFLTARIAFLFAGIANSAINPLVYALRMKALRAAFRDTLKSLHVKTYSWCCFNQDDPAAEI